MKDDIEFKLQQWGQWSRRNNPLNKLGYPNKAVCASLISRSNSPNALPDMNDDEAEYFDAVIARLKRRQTHENRVLKAIYIEQLSIRKTANMLGVSKTSIHRSLHRAKEYVETAFNQ